MAETILSLKEEKKEKKKPKLLGLYFNREGSSEETSERRCYEDTQEEKERERERPAVLVNGWGSPLYQAAFDQYSEGSDVRGHNASFHAII